MFVVRVLKTKKRFVAETPGALVVNRSCKDPLGSGQWKPISARISRCLFLKGRQAHRFRIAEWADI